MSASLTSFKPPRLQLPHLTPEEPLGTWAGLIHVSYELVRPVLFRGAGVY
jgi:hypothetical protein